MANIPPLLVGRYQALSATKHNSPTQRSAQFGTRNMQKEPFELLHIKQGYHNWRQNSLCANFTAHAYDILCHPRENTISALKTIPLSPGSPRFVSQNVTCKLCAKYGASAGYSMHNCLCLFHIRSIIARSRRDCCCAQPMYTHNHLDMRQKVFQSQGCACQEATTTDRNNASIKIRHLLRYFQTHCALTRQNVRIVIPEKKKTVYISLLSEIDKYPVRNQQGRWPE